MQRKESLCLSCWGGGFFFFGRRGGGRGGAGGEIGEGCVGDVEAGLGGC